MLLGDQQVDPEQLAYILIGVCVGLSILCLIVVAVTIGYKSETHYRLENGGNKSRKRITLIKASTSESSEADTEVDSEAGIAVAKASTEDLSANMKLGSWFTSKTVHTMDRKKAKMVYPSAVYLDNLEGKSVKDSNRSEAITDDENFEDDLNVKKVTSRAKITRKVTLTDDHSVSSLETIKSEDEGAASRPRNSSESTVTSETAQLTKGSHKRHSYGKKSGNYKLGAKSEAPSKHKYLAHRTASGSPIVGGSMVSSSREGSFRFLEHEEIEHTPNAKQKKKVDDDANSIQWSNNSDRLI